MILPIVTLMLLSSCNNSLENKAEKFIEKNYVDKLKDPSSYQKIDTKIIDTLFLRDEIQHEYDLHSFQAAIAKSLSEEFGDDSTEYKHEKHITDSLKMVLDKTDDKKISIIRLNHRFKALNGLGMLSPGNVIIYYKNDKFVIED